RRSADGKLLADFVTRRERVAGLAGVVAGAVGVGRAEHVGRAAGARAGVRALDARVHGAVDRADDRLTAAQLAGAIRGHAALEGAAARATRLAERVRREAARVRVVEATMIVPAAVLVAVTLEDVAARGGVLHARRRGPGASRLDAAGQPLRGV